ncbi:DUF885 domain-containing protein [uncultured Psychroserpens sp.]|uniref:DUF885 domain-containing protein n=1 Tax=uncultured Psychroserpens sp. TaxID=255436 RepID=UPI0026057F45|nr:DUF885 domain-containing protein [uncultured Psychroserpens sp.]
MKKTKFKLLILCVIMIQSCFSQSDDFDDLSAYFLETYLGLGIPNLQVNYVQNLNAIKSAESIKSQEAFFKNVKHQLSNINKNDLNKYQRLDYDIMIYEVGLNLERLSLEKEWDYTTVLNDSLSIYSIENGKEWYVYLLKRWVDAEVNPDDMFQFGLNEIETVKTEMEKLQQLSKLPKEAFNLHLTDSSFYYYNLKDIEKAFNNVKLQVAKSSSYVFPHIKDISDLKIAKGSNASLAQVPAYYNNSTFYFNYFEAPFNKRQIDWIYIHEGIPGHHYQIMVNNIVKRTEIQQLFWYPGFVEGWGAYVEYLGKDLGIYKTIYDEYGKWEWDLIRSVRVALDVGLNFYGWSDDKAMAFWKKHIANQDDIARREIARMKRWPAQVVTYKYGANQFTDMLSLAKQKENFNYKKFHLELLSHGDIPLSIVNIKDLIF